MPVDKSRFAHFEPRDDGATFLVRGYGMSGILPREWALPVLDGLIIPAGNEVDAKRFLRAAGYAISGGKSVEDRRRGPGPNPECSECHRPYPRGYVVRAGERCASDCVDDRGRTGPLYLVVVRTRHCRGGSACDSNRVRCPEGRGALVDEFVPYGVPLGDDDEDEVGRQPALGE